MITLGKVNFNFKDKYITEISRTTKIDYAELKKLSNKSVLQYTGQSADTLVLNCELIGSGIQNSTNISDLRAMAKDAEPYLLQDNKGIVGEFVIIQITEKLQYITQSGAKVNQFTLELKKHER